MDLKSARGHLLIKLANCYKQIYTTATKIACLYIYKSRKKKLTASNFSEEKKIRTKHAQTKCRICIFWCNDLWLQIVSQTRDSHGAETLRAPPAGLIGGDGVRDNPGSKATMRALIRSMTSTRCGRRAGSACHMSSINEVTLTGHFTWRKHTHTHTHTHTQIKHI